MSEWTGVWRIDLDDPRSRVWDPITQTHIPDPIGDEVITLREDGDTMTVDVEYGTSPTVHLHHSSVFDDPEWSPYTPLSKTGEPDDGEANWASEFVAGQPFSYVRLARISDRVHVRLMKTLDGEARAVLTRVLADDGQSYTAAVLDPISGQIKQFRVFIREG